jgi:hypothetical protein
MIPNAVYSGLLAHGLLMNVVKFDFSSYLKVSVFGLGKFH